MLIVAEIRNHINEPRSSRGVGQFSAKLVRNERLQFGKTLGVERDTFEIGERIMLLSIKSCALRKPLAQKANARHLFEQAFPSNVRSFQLIYEVGGVNFVAVGSMIRVETASMVVANAKCIAANHRYIVW